MHVLTGEHLETVQSLIDWKAPTGIRKSVRVVEFRGRVRIFLDLTAVDGDPPESIEVTSPPTYGELRMLAFAAKQVLEAAWERTPPFSLAEDVRRAG